MGNIVTIQRTIFQNIDENGNHLDATYGFRIYDDHDAAYDNFVPTLEDLKKLSQEDLIQRAMELNAAAREMVDFSRREGLPIIIDDKEVYVGSELTP